MLIDFQRQIQPILTESCSECHSQDKRKGGLSLATYDDVLEGGKDGAVVRPGRSADSLLVHRITGKVEPQMPKDNLPLSDAEIALLRLWIDQGARATPTAPAAPQPWEAPLALTRPVMPPIRWTKWTSPLDRIVADYLSKRRVAEPAVVSEARFARRAYLDVWGLLPTPEDLRAFVDDRSPKKRDALVDRLLADNERYAEHWMSFWNDLLRNEDGVTYFSESARRQSITDWLYTSLASNLRYDEFVRRLLNPIEARDPEGFLVGVNWRGETSAAVTPWMQAAQNTAQIFLGVNLKCNACHDSFVSKWKLKDAYSLAAYFSAEPRLQLYRCDVAQDAYAEPQFLFPELSRPSVSSTPSDRKAALAAIVTDPRNGRLPRTLVNRLWYRLVGHGIVGNPDEMDGKPWSPALLDWMASDFVEHGYDVKHVIRTIVTSRAYQMPAVARRAEPAPRHYAFDGPEVRRLTAEQFNDAIGAITGEWNLRQPTGGGTATRGPSASEPQTVGSYAREWRAASSTLTRALGRPIRDQVISFRAAQATTPQALELVNGQMLTHTLARGAQRMIGEVPAEPPSLFNKAVAGRNARPVAFDVDVSKATKLWLLVQDFGSNAPERVLPAWVDATFAGPQGPVPLSSLTPLGSGDVRSANGTANPTMVRTKNPSRLVYDISGRGFSRLTGSMALENSPNEIGSTLNPQVRFYVFDTEPNMDSLLPPAPDVPLPAGPALTRVSPVVDRVFWHALGRAPSAAERTLAERAIADPSRPGRVSADGLADLLWAVLMKPEFQLIY
jgi:Protein of unknown function (DUF1549)/Protein of unknown function (DUF1553)/Planctomycete cytochrome C